MAFAATRVFSIGELVENILLHVVEIESQEMPIARVMQLLLLRQRINHMSCTTINNSNPLLEVLWMLPNASPPSPEDILNPLDGNLECYVKLNPLFDLQRGERGRSFSSPKRRTIVSGPNQNMPANKLPFRIQDSLNTNLAFLEYSTDIFSHKGSWLNMIAAKSAWNPPGYSFEIYAYEEDRTKGSKLVWFDLKGGMTAKEIFEEISKGGKRSFS